MRLVVSDPKYTVSPTLVREIRHQMRMHRRQVDKKSKGDSATVLVPESGFGRIGIEYAPGVCLPLDVRVIADSAGVLMLMADPERRAIGFALLRVFWVLVGAAALANLGRLLLTTFDM